MHLRKRLIANMQANYLEALKGGTRSQSNDGSFDSVDYTICPGQMHCVHNITI
ncbi:MAG: hypothetical protein AB8B65_03430 [Kordia sp.]|uniref:hypothetical protein n=1 Tax=Kordia sp. TaxID=1965332 RepID=UPI0038582ECB